MLPRLTRAEARERGLVTIRMICSYYMIGRSTWFRWTERRDAPQPVALLEPRGRCRCQQLYVWRQVRRWIEGAR